MAAMLYLMLGITTVLVVSDDRVLGAMAVFCRGMKRSFLDIVDLTLDLAVGALPGPRLIPKRFRQRQRDDMGSGND